MAAAVGPRLPCPGGSSETMVVGGQGGALWSLLLCQGSSRGFRDTEKHSKGLIIHILYLGIETTDSTLTGMLISLK